MQTVYERGGGGSQQRQVADGADVVFTDTVFAAQFADAMIVVHILISVISAVA